MHVEQSPLKGLILRMAVPSMASMLVTAIYNMVDTYFVGFIGTSATGAVGVVFSLMAIIMATGLFFGQGSGNAISRALGEQRQEEASHLLSTGFFCCFGVGVVIAVVGLIFMEDLARLLGATETILPHACGYMQYILIGTPFMAASLTLNNQLRFQGSPKNGMFGIMAGALINIVLDPIFIFALDMGTAGAGLATMLSQFCSFCILLYGCTRGGQSSHPVSGFRPDPGGGLGDPAHRLPLHGPAAVERYRRHRPQLGCPGLWGCGYCGHGHRFPADELCQLCGVGLWARLSAGMRLQLRGGPV